MDTPGLTVEVSISEMLNTDDEDIPESGTLKKWAVMAYRPACRKNADAMMLPASVSIRITDSEEIQQLNDQFRDKNTPTNVLSFPMHQVDELALAAMPFYLLGDIALCASVIRQEAETQGKPLASHWAHMVIHGMLHLQGYDHIKTGQAQQMEKLEVSLLNQLGYANPYH